MKKQVNVYMDERFHAKLKRAAEKLQMSVSTYVFNAVKKMMEGK